MVFSSLEFLFIFLPLFLIIYYILPSKFKNLCLLIGSLAFYIYGTLDNPLYILLLLVSILVNYLLGIMMEHSSHNKKTWLIIGLIYNLGWLFIFKYADFIFSNVNQLIDFTWPFSTSRLPIWNLILPIGISFYTFTEISYLVDVYKGKVDAETSIVNFASYICMFPKLISGPIVTYSEIKDSLQSRKHTLDNFNEGLKIFTVGLGYKVILANQIGNLWSDIGAVGYESISTPLAWMGIIAFSLQLYFDFYGYSLMAIGLGMLLGFRLPRNFAHPYLATSMTEFWRKWHITLGSWFREYVYIPLGGNRKGNSRTVLNTLIVWLFTGLWHGASWNYVLWGFVLFLIIIIEKFGLKKILDKYKVFGHGYMILLIPLTWLLFAISDFSQLEIYFGRLFPFFSTSFSNVFRYDYIKYGNTYGVLLIIGGIFCTKLPLKLYTKLKDNILGTTILLIIFWVSIYLIYIGRNDPFLYFRF